MKPDRWQKVEEIYHAALEREPGLRARFVREASGGDDSPRKEVESLLGYEPKAEDFIESPALEVAAKAMAEDQARSEGTPGKLVGQTISHYRVLEKIGAGGMGVVYRARDKRLNRDVAVKVLPADSLTDEAARKRFRKEAQALSQLNHPHIATVHDFDMQDGTDFLVMEYVAGKTLSEKLTGGPFPEKEVADLRRQMASALEEAHEHGVIHRDLKPGNITVTAKGQAKVLDFGLAKLVRPMSESTVTDSMTDTGAVVGTFPYMPPEKLRGQEIDSRTDLYALGNVLYEMATGQRTFPERNSARLITQILHEPPRPPIEVNRQVSPGLESIILNCLEKEPENRYQSAKLIERRFATAGH